MVARTAARVIAVALAAVALAFAWAPSAEAFTCTTTGCTFNALYTEPTTVQTGAPLTNLTSCTVSYTTAQNGGIPGPAKTVVVPASSPNGGGAINRPITDASLLPGHNYAVVARVACTNPSGTGPQGAASVPLPISRAGEVPPAGTPVTLQ